MGYESSPSSPTLFLFTNLCFVVVLSSLSQTSCVGVAVGALETGDHNHDAPLLPEVLLELSYIAAKLSSLAYEDPETAVMQWQSSYIAQDTAYEDIQFFTSEPDTAVLARKEGRCFLAFRGTTISLRDWQQNLNPDTRRVYRANNATQESCRVRSGYSDFQFLANNSTSNDPTDAIVDCLRQTNCTTNSDCLILTGHSQGGASAVIFSILMADYHPTVITFGAPAGVEAGCPLMSQRSYRYINTITDRRGRLEFDPVPLLSGRSSSALAHYGHVLVLLGGGEYDDNSQSVTTRTTVHYAGYNENSTTLNDDRYYTFLQQLDVLAHRMRNPNGTVPHSYQGRLAHAAHHHVVQQGFPAGAPCSPHWPGLCGSSTVCTNGWVCPPTPPPQPLQQSWTQLVEENENTQDDERLASSAAVLLWTTRCALVGLLAFAAAGG